MLELSLSEIAAAVGGRLAQADPETRVDNLSTDSRTVGVGDLYWALRGERFDGHDFCEEALRKGARAVVMEDKKLPNLRVPSIRVPDSLAALGDLAHFLRQKSEARFIGVTGSVGKTTTKEFLRRALEKFAKTRATEGNLNNLIGVPKTLAQVEPDDRYVVLEIGIDRPGEMDRLADMTTPDVGVITSVSEAHLERMGDIETVVKEKSRLLTSLKPAGLAVVPHDSPYREDLVAASKAPAVTFGTTLGSDYFAADPKMKTRGCYRFLLETPHGKGEVELQVPGEHMVQAATAAAAVAVSSGLPLAGVIEGLQTFTGLPGRCEVIEMTDGITVIADHYNANPVSMKSAQHLLESFVERRKVFIAGEMWDLGTQSVSLHRMVGKRLGSGSIDLLVAVGPKTRELTRAAQEAGLPRRSIRWFDTTETAALEVPRLLMPSDVVLVKGSRGMKLEKVVDSLTRHFGSQAGSRGNSC